VTGNSSLAELRGGGDHEHAGVPLMADEQQPSGGVPSTWATHPSQRSSSPGGPGEKPGREPVAGAERPGQQVIGSLDRYLGAARAMTVVSSIAIAVG
jgi:hypothetical protein